MMHSGGYENLASGRQTEGGQKERVNWCSVSLFVFLDPVPSIPMEQHPQKSIASALPPSPVGDVRPATHPAPLEKPSELSASGKSHFLLSEASSQNVESTDLLFLALTSCSVLWNPFCFQMVWLWLPC